MLVELNCETDFAARSDDFQELVRNLAMHVAAAAPRFTRREDVSEEILAEEREIAREQALKSGKPEKVIDRIVEGKLEKFFSENVLLEQAYVKDPQKSVEQLITEVSAKTGEKIEVARFARLQVGGGS